MPAIIVTYFLADRIKEQIDPEDNFAADLIMNSDFNDVRYLYYYGEYVSENEKRTAMHLNELPLETIQKMADVYTEGYRIGFVNTGKNLSKKATVNIRYTLGFERVIRIAIEKFSENGTKADDLPCRCQCPYKEATFENRILRRYCK